MVLAGPSFSSSARAAPTSVSRTRTARSGGPDRPESSQHAALECLAGDVVLTVFDLHHDAVCGRFALLHVVAQEPGDQCGDGLLGEPLGPLPDVQVGVADVDVLAVGSEVGGWQRVMTHPPALTGTAGSRHASLGPCFTISGGAIAMISRIFGRASAPQRGPPCKVTLPPESWPNACPKVTSALFPTGGVLPW